MKNVLPLILPFLFLTVILSAQQVTVIDPPFWWADMPVAELQIQLYGEELGYYRASVDYEGIEIIRQIAVDSPNYLFIYLDISKHAKPGQLNIKLTRDGNKIDVPYQLLQRESSQGRYQGFDSKDVIYLMMPDRFANGNPDNDSIKGMLEKANRQDPTKRQGGDIQGVRDHLDYIQEIGMTAIWFTPIIENDMKPEYGAYHGYAATNLYKVDRRYGSNEEYKALIDEVHRRGMKVIMDMINNHIGDQHWWMKDLPTKDWVNDIEKFGTTSFRGSVASDPYASNYDINKLTKGWFVPEMPDLNQNNELLGDYLIQNTLWWIEYSGIDGIRMDTYVYPDKEFMARWAKQVLDAYPTLNIVGEAWVNTVQMSGFWQYDDEGASDGYQSNLPSVTDFPFANTVRSAFNQNFGWTQGLRSLYYLFAQDAVYENPMLNVIFLDNHDMGRIFETLGKNKEHFKMTYAFLMTARGIPQVYYGTELMMEHENRGGDDEGWRQTMPGGWPDDTRSIFTKEGRTTQENETFEYVKTLTKWRNTSKAAQKGKFLHFVPEEDIYVYFRIHEQQTVMVIMNNNAEARTIGRDRFAEILDGFTSGKNILTKEAINVRRNFKVPPKTTSIWELEK